MKAKLIMSGLAALGFMAGTSSVYAQDDAARDAIAERLAPVGQLCLQGQDCGTAAAPAAAASSGGDIDGEGIYGNVCSACHESGAAGAPIRGDEAAWAERTEQGFATLLEHSINGIGAMPARGGNPNLSDEEMEAATAYMVEPVMEVPELGGGEEAAADEGAVEETAAAEDEAVTEETATEETAVASDDAASEEDAAASEEASGGSGLDGEALYASSGCVACHASGVAGSPMLGDSEAWAARLEKGADELYASAINGIGAMPAKGGNPNLSDEEVMAIVDYMVAEVE
ncbi:MULTISPECIES: c-type cytochrome [unclassified Halomonas]|uniref:c-type cytochrome n=1 Tax=unclassified Halomonas TaxID=2609666 RepID=UPI0007D97A79|nr:c-type cytochrome [Halomonas sp. ALS9]MBT2787606.1 cytochrome c5 family protein [Halomonas sp. ISL-106]MBT2799011.1 cytochrome c5 family protein [Halomonas sp. ISL-104]OAL61554.1 cytochrome C [Halomonas sp. ALS9]